MAAFCAASGKVFFKKSGTAFWNWVATVDWAPKQVSHEERAPVTAVERMSGIPQSAAVLAPPESKADIEPTAAKTLSHMST